MPPTQDLDGHRAVLDGRQLVLPLEHGVHHDVVIEVLTALAGDHREVALVELLQPDLVVDLVVVGVEARAVPEGGGRHRTAGELARGGVVHLEPQIGADGLAQCERTAATRVAWQAADGDTAEPTEQERAGFATTVNHG